LKNKTEWNDLPCKILDYYENGKFKVQIVDPYNGEEITVVKIALKNLKWFKTV